MKCACRRRTPKRQYETIEAAWLASSLVFIERGWVLTPYWCPTWTMETTEVQILPGFRFDFRTGRTLLKPRVRVYRRTATYYGCGRWHLTSCHRAMLPA